ncbi:MAG TPA: hypothetical protein VMU86_00735, partial [Steroidobacteraceae bacterium]|nr:hypothetical protein [Steroidobacteraceae bacterium]
MRQDPLERRAVTVDVGARLGFGRTDEQCGPELGVIARHIETAEDAIAREFIEERRDRAVEAKHGLVEAWTREGDAHAGQARQPIA